jgi:hypothetical protein
MVMKTNLICRRCSLIRVRWFNRYNAVMADSISARLANVVLPEAGGHDVRLGSLWEQRPAVVVFLRHYG